MQRADEAPEALFQRNYRGGHLILKKSIAAFGVGPLKDAGISLSTIFGFTAIIAAVMGLLSFFVVHRRPAPAGEHVRERQDHPARRA